MALTIDNTNLVINTEPEYADQIVTLTSSDESVVEPVLVSTSDSGVNTWTLVPHGVGTATITATTPGGATSSVDVTVTDDGSGEDSGGGSGSEPIPSTIPVERVYFHESNSNTEIESLTLALDKSGFKEMTPYITVEPSDATDRSWRLISSNTNVLSVSGSSVFTNDPGSCSLTVMTSNDCADTVAVTVVAQPARSVSFSVDSLQLPIGSTKNLAELLVFNPENSIFDGYTITSSQPAIARMDGDSIKGVASGQTVATVTTSSGRIATMTVIVPAGDGGSSQEGIPTSFSIGCSKTTLVAGEEATVWISNVEPLGLDLASTGELRLSFTNNRCYVVGSPDEDGTFTIKAYDNPGNDTVWMSWRNGNSGWISSEILNLTINSSDSGSTPDPGDTEPTLSSISITLSKSSGFIPGENVQAGVTVSPSNYSPRSIQWSSSNTSVATITNAGYISCVGEGTVVISVTVDGMNTSRTLVIGNDNGSEIPGDWDPGDADLFGTNVAAPLVPFTAADTYATHHAKYGKGGYRSVSNISERNGIPELRREEGMLVWVISEEKLYQLRNGYWVLFSDTETPPPGGNCNCREELEPRIAALEAILLKQQQDKLLQQLENSPYTLSITGLQPSGSKYEVGTDVGNLSFNYSLSGPSPVPAMTSAVINGATYSNPTGSYSGGTVNSSSSGSKTLYDIKVTYFDTRYAQLDAYRDAGGLQKTATASKNIMFGYKIYCGKTTLEPDNFTWANLSSSTIGTPSIVTGLPAKSSPLTFSYTVHNGRAWVAYPKAWGQNVDIRDSLGQSYAIDFSFKEISVPVAGSQVPYYVYYLTDTSDADDFEFNFSKK